jgi:trehalose-phosphatase
VELAQNPWGVVADDEITGLVDRLHSLSGGALALVTGRSIDDVDELLPFSGFALAGQHGIELRYSTGERSIPSMKSGDLDAVREILRAAAEKHPGLVVEDKGMSIALHYRNDPRLGSYAHRLMRSLQARHAPHYALQRGKRVVELKPEGNKIFHAAACIRGKEARVRGRRSHRRGRFRGGERDGRNFREDRTRQDSRSLQDPRHRIPCRLASFRGGEAR